MNFVAGVKGKVLICDRPVKSGTALDQQHRITVCILSVDIPVTICTPLDQYLLLYLLTFKDQHGKE